jgi:hypothetical protein
MISHGVWAGVVQDEHWTRLGDLGRGTKVNVTPGHRMGRMKKFEYNVCWTH